MAVNRQELGELLRKGLSETSTETETDETSVDESLDTLPVEEEEETLVSETETEEETLTETEEIEEQEEHSDIQDLVQLATAIEVDPEFLYTIKIPMSDGMESVSLSELKDGYTEYKRGTNEGLRDLESKRTAFETYQQQQISVLTQQQALPQEIVAAQATVMAIANQYNSYDWATLEQSNPGEAALQKQNMASAYQQAQGKHQELVLGHQQYLSKTAETFAVAQHEAIARHIPEWNDNTIRVREQDLMRTMLRDEYGYSDDDINGIEDSRAMRMARDLMKLKDLSSKAKETIKKITKVPKILKSGSKAIEGSSKVRRTAEAVDRAKNTKSDREKAAQIGKLFRGEI